MLRELLSLDVKRLTPVGRTLLVVTAIVLLTGGTAVLAFVGQVLPRAGSAGNLLILPVILAGGLFFYCSARVLAARGHPILKPSRPSVLEFDRPSDEVIERIHDILSAAPVHPTPHDPIAFGGEPIPPDVQGDLDEVIGWLYEALLEDSVANESEHRSWTGDFDYAVEWLQPATLMVATRLFKSPPEGAIVYGSFIRRVSDSEFWLWDGQTA